MQIKTIWLIHILPYLPLEVFTLTRVLHQIQKMKQVHRLHE